MEPSHYAVLILALVLLIIVVVGIAQIGSMTSSKKTKRSTDFWDKKDD